MQADAKVRADWQLAMDLAHAYIERFRQTRRPLYQHIACTRIAQARVIRTFALADGMRI